MDNILIDRLENKIIQRLFRQSIEVEASGRHVHLCKDDVEKLFGKGHALTKKSDLSQPRQFACQERITLEGPKKSIRNVIVLGPERPETQVEVSLTDAVILGVKPPVRMSGHITGTPGIKLVGPAGEVERSKGVIVAKRHIHMTPGDAEYFGVADQEEVSFTTYGERSMTFHNVTVRVSPSFATYMHIDYDEANACSFSKGMRGFIIKQTV
ncbi:MAG: phosphate propanoyltransferase [Hungatella sp.]|jgi:propanediol utilization protein|nr:phosphate propanoyltransferase [Hungatella sp.]